MSETAISSGELLAGNEIDFGDLTPIEVPIRLDKRRYVLREPPNGAVERYERLATQGMEVTFDDVASTRIIRGLNAAGNESWLIAQCLYVADDHGRVQVNAKGDADPATLVPQGRINFWPSRVRKRLWDELTRMCPELLGNESVESLTKQRDKLDERIERLQARDPKKLPDAGTGSSGSLDIPAS